MSGERRAGFDVADEGRDKCAVAVRHGVTLKHLEAWSGKGSDTAKSTRRAAGIAEQHGCGTLNYDADGIGASVRAAMVTINEQRLAAGKPEIEAEPFRGSGAVDDPDGSSVEGRANRDFFTNRKAQDYWRLRERFELTHRVVEAAARDEPLTFNADEIISIDRDLPLLNQFVAELGQIRWLMTAAGKVLIDKAPEGTASPNLADATMIAFALQSGAYFSGVRTARTVSASETAPVMPMWLDKVFASLVIAEDVAAVVYCAANAPDGDGSRGVGLWVLDWDAVVLAEGADRWLTSLDASLIALRASLPALGHAQALGVYLDDFEQGWANALDQLGVRTNVVGAELPSLAERFNKSRPYVARGLVALGAVAARKEITFRGSRRNFLREVVNASAPPESNALALAFATAVLLTYHGRAAIPTPTLSPEQFPRPPSPPLEPPDPPMWQTHTGVWHTGPPPADYQGLIKSRRELGF